MELSKTIILLGIKHSGKTTLGKMLAEYCGYTFIDTDDLIQSLSGKTPHDLYKENGLSSFTSMEEEACRHAVNLKNKAAVIATGGGICSNPPALEILREAGNFIFLQVEEETAVQRIINRAKHMPDGNFENLPAYISIENPKTENQIRNIFKTYYVERNCIYSKIADITIFLNEKTKEENFLVLLNNLKDFIFAH